MHYSPSNNGFYSPEIHTVIPSDATEVSDTLYTELLAGQARGMLISVGPDGQPVLCAPPEDNSVEHRANIIATRRYQAEISGITTNGMALPTDRDSQALVSGAALAAVVDPAYHCQWKTLDGFIDLQAPQILEMAAAVRLHVQTCFDREAELLDHLEKGTFTEDMLDHGWPA